MQELTVIGSLCIIGSSSLYDPLTHEKLELLYIVTKVEVTIFALPCFLYYVSLQSMLVIIKNLRMSCISCLD